MTSFVIGLLVAVVPAGLEGSIALNVPDKHFKITRKFFELIKNIQQAF